MQQILDTTVFGKYNVQDVLIIFGAAIAFLILFRILMRVFRKEEGNKYFQPVDCLNCGWHGKVSTLAGRCPKCNQPLGDQKAWRKK